MKNFIYENAPLVEVITEVKWALQKMSPNDDRQWDPHFDSFKSNIATQLTDFPFMEQLVPDFVPRELLAYQPLFRFRSKEDAWPLFQIGPGIFSANVIPHKENQYAGWTAFKEHTEKGIKALLALYPMASNTLKITSIKLTYLDAFEEENGVCDTHAFIKDKLGLLSGFPLSLEKFAETSKGQGIQSVFETLIPLKNVDGGTLTIKCGSGLSDGKPAVLIENQVTKEMNYQPNAENAVEEIMSYFEECHEITRSVFEEFIAPKITDMLGKKIQIE